MNNVDAESSVINNVIRKQVVPAFGCTDPVAIGLAASLAYKALEGSLPTWIAAEQKRLEGLRVKTDDLEKILVEVDRDIFKNSQAVGIPGTGGLRGIAIAVALGLLCDPEKKLSLFEDASPDVLSKAKEIVDRSLVTVRVVDGWDEQSDVRIRVAIKIKDEDGLLHDAEATILHMHQNPVLIKRDGEVIFNKSSPRLEEYDEDMFNLSKMNLSQIIDRLNDLYEENRELISRSIRTNIKASEFGLSEAPGLKVGYTLHKLVEEGVLGEDLINLAKIKTAAAADARMSGCEVPVVSCAGSGNQGLVASLPITAIAEKVGWDEENVTRAVGLSFLITSYVTAHSEYLSALCGCAVKAGAGAAAGVAYYLGGNVEQIGAAIKNTIGSITGMICDGAKVGCAMKLATAAATAVESALLALEGVEIPPDNGIVCISPEETMKNVGRISKGMVSTDRVILEIMNVKSTA